MLSKALLLGPKTAITDGTAAGSTQIGAPGGILKNFVVHGSEVFAAYAYQQATGGAPPLSLWVTDGMATMLKRTGARTASLRIPKLSASCVPM